MEWHWKTKVRLNSSQIHLFFKVNWARLSHIKVTWMQAGVAASLPSHWCGTSALLGPCLSHTSLPWQSSAGSLLWCQQQKCPGNAVRSQNLKTVCARCSNWSLSLQCSLLLLWQSLMDLYISAVGPARGYKIAVEGTLPPDRKNAFQTSKRVTFQAAVRLVRWNIGSCDEFSNLSHSPDVRGGRKDCNNERASLIAWRFHESTFFLL